MSNLEWFSTKRNSDGSFSILVPKDWPESIKHKALDAIELGIQAGAEKERERIIKLLEHENSHSIEFESITLQAGMEPNWVKKHSDYCPGCIAIAIIKGECK